VSPLWPRQIDKAHLLCIGQFCLKVVCIKVVGGTFRNHERFRNEYQKMVVFVGYHILFDTDIRGYAVSD
jgi:hypothetical protein